jgi:hypothetical protein
MRFLFPKVKIYEDNKYNFGNLHFSKKNCIFVKIF